MKRNSIAAWSAGIRRTGLRGMLVLLVVGTSALAGAEPIVTDTHRFSEVRNGIYLANTLAPVFNSNSLVIVNDRRAGPEGSLDSHGEPLLTTSSWSIRT